MDRVFIVCGYGVPKDIFKDSGYKTYLSFVFNKIFEFSRDHKEDNIYIIFSGGKTDLISPYKRTEAGEMKKMFISFMKIKTARKETAKWKVLLEPKALSTLENIINAKEIIQNKKLKIGNAIDIFCEFTRKGRIQKISKAVFGGDYNISVHNIDFSTLENRYLEREYISKKEKSATRFDLWALESEDNFKKYHKNFVEKFEFFRTYDSNDKGQEAIKAWWEKDIDFNNL